MTRRLLLLFSIAAGAAVSNLYWSQPLLRFIAEDLHVDATRAGALIAVTQLGHAVGVFLLVPLGDLLDRRVLVPAALLCCAAALLAGAVAPTFGVLLVALALVGLTTVSGQLLAALAGDLGGDGDRGRVVGTVVSGILVGILVSRTASGLVAAVAGWRAIYLVAAGLSVLLAVLLRRAIPSLPPRPRLGYGALLLSVVQIVRRQRAVRWSLVLGGTSFGLFTLFWTALTFLLSAPPYSYSVAGIGLFGLIGLAGAITAQGAGRFEDRGRGLAANGAAWALVLVSFVVAGFGTTSVAVLIVAIVLLDIAVQAQNITVQTRLFTMDATARSRINTAFVTNNFVCGAIGSALAAFLFAHGGWPAVCIAGAVLAGFALTWWAVGRRGPLQPAR